MKNIRLKSIKMLNFKGVRNCELSFDEKTTSIYGCNGSGKTSVFDAFVWVLFGKDSQDRKQFAIKTLDENGNAIPKIPHEVTAILDVDGEAIELRRTYSEKWTKRRGSLVEEFTGHEEERFYNGVPCSVSEWAYKIERLCPENVFKFITNPHYFTAQPASVQRSLLLEMAGGEISNEDVARGNKEYEEFLNELSGKTLEEFKKEMSAKRKRVKAEADGIPARIDERKREIQILEEVDYVAVDAEKSEKEARVKEIDSMLQDSSKALDSVNQKKKELYEQVTAEVIKRNYRKEELAKQLMADYWSAQDEKRKIEDRVREVKEKIDSNYRGMAEAERSIKALKAEREDLIVEWKEIKSHDLNLNEDSFVCPTCGRKYEADEIESRMSAITEKFNADKAKRLARNVEMGKEVKKRLEEKEKMYNLFMENETILRNMLSQITDDPRYTDPLPERPDVDAVLNADAEYTASIERQKEIERQIGQLNDSNSDSADISALKAEKASLLNSISEDDKILGQRENIARNEERIAVLEKECRGLSTELTKIEKSEYVASEFSKAKIKALEGKINAMFEMVDFKMFDTQVNGAVVETCEATVNGVPYSSLNNAAQIHAGLDIIGTICNARGITAPIFIDNAESINTFAENESQMVLLYVSNDNKLKIR